VMRAQASDGGMLPEQVWDGPDVEEHELYNGRASGGAMPLVWAHAEYAKLVRSLHDGRVFDMPQQPYERYVRTTTASTVAIWSSQNPSRTMSEGCTLRIQTAGAASITWWLDDPTAVHEAAARDTTLPGVWIADLDTAGLPPATVVRFSLRTADGSVDGGHVISVV
jgi:glucoamylase